MQVLGEKCQQMVLGEPCLAMGAGGQLSGSDVLRQSSVGHRYFNQRAFLVPRTDFHLHLGWQENIFCPSCSVPALLSSIP